MAYRVFGEVARATRAQGEFAKARFLKVRFTKAKRADVEASRSSSATLTMFGPERSKFKRARPELATAKLFTLALELLVPSSLKLGMLHLGASGLNKL